MKEKLEQEILSILQGKQFDTVEEISATLYVSTATVRRKLTALQDKGLVIRTHGGAQLNDANNKAPSFDLRVHTNSLAKRKIALSAIKLIKNGDLIFLDGSTSSYLVAEYLQEFSDISVLTNGIDTLSLLAKNKVKGYSTGGVISSVNQSTLVGQLAIETTKKMHANIAFFSAQSIDSIGNIYDCYEQENYLRKTMMDCADVKVFLCDDTKVDRRSPYFLCNVSEVDYVITTADLDKFFNGKFSKKIIKA